MRLQPAAALLLVLSLLLAGCVPGFFGTPVPPPQPVAKRPPEPTPLTNSRPRTEPGRPRATPAPAPLAAERPPVDQQALLAPPPPGKRAVIGHSESETEGLLGKPVRITERASAKVWHYQSDDCAVDVTFFFDVSRGRFFALDVTPVTGELNRCLAKFETRMTS